MIGMNPSERPVHALPQALGSVPEWYERSDASILHVRCSRVNLLGAARTNLISNSWIFDRYIRNIIAEPSSCAIELHCRHKRTQCGSWLEVPTSPFGHRS
jgi:hypothetical protein